MYVSKYIYLTDATVLVNERTGTPRGRGPLWDALRDGEIRAELRTRAGFKPLLAAWWEDDSTFEWAGTRQPGDEVSVAPILVGREPDRTPHLPSERDIRLIRNEVERLWPVQGEASQSQTKVKGSDTAKNKGGNPGKYDWEGAMIEMARVAVFGEDLNRELLSETVSKWFAARGEYPTDSLVREKVRRFYEALWPPKT